MILMSMMNLMSLNRITEGVGKKHYECEVCFVKKKHSPYFKLLPHPAIIKLLINIKERIVCNSCAMREEFGSKYRQHPRYKEWVEDK